MFRKIQERTVVVEHAEMDVLGVAKQLGDSLQTWIRPGASVTFVQASVTALPFGDRSFDIVTARLLFQHLTDPGRVVDELRRVLRPGGCILVFDVDDATKNSEGGG